jgi:signal transduction histidine kinase
MIVLPVFLSAIVGLLIYLAAVYISTERYRETAEAQRGRSEARSLVRSWPRDVSLSEMLEDINVFNARFSENVRLSLYRDGQPVLPASSFVQDTADIMKTSTFFSIRNTEGYQVILTRIETRVSVLRVGHGSPNLVIATSIFIFVSVVVLIVFLTNRFLTRFVFNTIIMSINALKYGVGQIRDGNLKHRLDTDQKNEFDDVSADFNEMAERLSDFVSSRLQDEATRKELIAGISHDLRTPLTSARAYIEGIENGLDSTPEVRTRYIQTIKNKLRDLEQITDTLFLFSSLELDEFPWNIEKHELTSELKQIVTGLIEEYENRGLGISLFSDTTETWVNLDSRQLRNVLINIIENSVKYKIKEYGKIEIHISKLNSTAFITMTDDGPGVPEESLARLFDIFYRVDSSRSETVKGNGLGLAMVAKLIRSFGGKIHAENNLAGGLSVIMQFPIVEELEAAIP